MEFTDYDHSFCEAKLWGGPPEYVNSVTSIFISLMGYYGLKKNSHHNNYIFLLYSALLINGITSFFYHWTNQIGWGLLDRMSMVLIAIPAIYGSIKEISYLNKYDKNSEKKILFLTQIYFTCLITSCALGFEEIFNGLFGVFLGMIIYFIITIDKKHDKINPHVRFLIRNGKIGLYFIAFAGILWILIEKFCDTFDMMKYLHGHALWHIFVSFGGYLLSLLIVGLSLDRKNILPTYIIDNMCITKKN